MQSRTGHRKYHAPRKISIELESCSNVVISKKSYEINPYRDTRFAWAGGTSGQEFLVYFKHSFTSFSYPLLTDGSRVADTLRNLGAIQLCLCTSWLRMTLTTNQQDASQNIFLVKSELSFTT
jgi:hypothetical protein